jgi:hypothetical protein
MEQAERQVEYCFAHTSASFLLSAFKYIPLALLNPKA